MELTFENGHYYLSCTYEERKAVKAMGFKWCNDTKRWFTNNWWVAMQSPAAIQNSGLHFYRRQITNSFSQKSQGIINDSKLMPFQNAGVEEIRERKNVLLADEQGLGKTAQAISYLNIAQLPPHQRIIIICPASLKLNWVREFIKFGSPGAYHIKVMTHGKDRIRTDKSILTGKTCNVVIVNYDLLKSRFMLDQLLAFDATILIGDEVHYLKNPKTARTKNVGKLINKKQKVIFISGTPMTNRPMELYPILKMISPETIRPFDDWKRYAYRFCNGHDGRWGFDATGSSHEAELGDRLRATCMIRRLKKDVLDQLPDKTLTVLPFEQNKATGKIIEQEYRFTFDLENLKKHPEKGTVGDLAKLRHELTLAKLPQSIAAIQDLLQSVDKVVVFAWHRDVMEGLKVGLEEFNPVLLVGGMSINNKQASVDAFQKDDKVRVFIGQIQAAGVGITLTASSHVEFVEATWVPGEIDQAVDRCHRIGQKSSVNVRFHVVEKSLDETMLVSILKKKKVINKILK